MKNVLVLGMMVALFASACTKDRIRLNGEGPIVIEERSVRSFDDIKVELDADVIWHYDSNPKLILEAQKNIAAFIEVDQNGAELTIKLKNFTSIRKHEPITIHVYSTTAEGITVSGSGDVVVEKNVVSKSIKLKVSGSGKIVLQNQVTDKIEGKVSGSGKITIESTEQCNDANYNISGSGKVYATNTPTLNVEADISGSGKVEVNAVSKLDVKISGSGKVKYKGTPQIESKITGSGKIEKI